MPETVAGVALTPTRQAPTLVALGHQGTGSMRTIARRGMSLVELVVAVLLLGVLLFGLVGWTRYVRGGLRERLAVSMLTALNAALDAYRDSGGAYPPEAPDDSAQPVIAALRTVPASAAALAAIPDTLWTNAAPPQLVDPWGRPLRCLGPARHAARVAAGGGRPVMVCAGPDRDFGDRQPAALGDNIAGDDAEVIDHSSHAAIPTAAAPEPDDPTADAP